MPCPPRMLGCRADCLHRALVRDYQAARERDEATREAECLGYAGDEAAYTGRMVTFRGWLEGLAGTETYARTPSAPEDQETAA